jgi:hypothetical protein
MELPALPDSDWNPFVDTKESCQKELDAILDALLEVLETCAGVGYREHIRSFQADIAASRCRIANYREEMISAPSEQSLNAVQGIWSRCREGLEEQIEDEIDLIAERDRQIGSLKTAFRKHLQEIGVDISPETADSFLLPVEDGIVSIAAVIANIGCLTEQLQHLVDQGREQPSHTKKYYGVYLLLVLAVDRIEKRFVDEAGEVFIPKLRAFELEAGRNIADARAQIARGGPKEQLLANVSAGERTVDACRVFADTLRDQRRAISDRNRETQRMLAAARNTYKTVRLSIDVAELIGQCQAAYRALRELKLPRMRTFQNLQLNEEMQRLAERVVEKG